MSVGEIGYRPLSRLIVDRLRQRIRSGAYRPGERLNMAELAQAFGVSTVPVREALRNLEAEGLVLFQPNRGATVRELSATEVRELFLIRAPLETLAATEAARHASPEALVTLQAVLAEMEADDRSWTRLHGHFHNQLYALSGLPRLAQLVGTLRDQMRPYIDLYVSEPDQRARAQAEHRAMLDALRQGDRATLAQLVPTHLGTTARVVARALGAADIDLPISLLADSPEPHA